MKPRKQVAALPFRRKKSGKIQLLLVTTRETRGWIAPKGWVDKGQSSREAAETEALEEAGVRGKIAKKPVGKYKYKKRLKGGKNVPCVVQIYPLKVKKIKDDWKERKQRRRKWFSPKAAARQVRDRELRTFLKAYAKDLKAENQAA